MHKGFHKGWIIGAVAALWATSLYGIEVSQIRCEGRVDPSGIGPVPCFNWLLSSDRRGTVQSAYQIRLQIAEDSADSSDTWLWDSGPVASDQSQWVPYAGPPLKAGTTYRWQVRLWDQDHYVSSWSPTGTFTTALFTPEDWHGAQWIGLEDLPDANRVVPGVHPWGRNVRGLLRRRPVVPLFRRVFSLPGPARRARLFICGLGHYEATLNGRPVADEFLSPGWSDYDDSCLVNSYDVTGLLHSGQNVLAAVVGPGFYHQHNERYRKLLVAYGMPKLIALLEVTCDDGSVHRVVSDTQWRVCPSPITFSSLYGGESYDARLEQPGWDRPGFAERPARWQAARRVTPPRGRLTPQVAPPVILREPLPPKGRRYLGDGRWVFDFGQNAAGIVQVRLKGRAGQTVKLIPGELLRQDHQVDQRATGSPYYYEITLKDDQPFTWRPRFTYYGFRYVQVEGVQPSDRADRHPNAVVLQSLQFLRCTTGAALHGRFQCSNDLFNRTYRLILNAIRSNLQSVITDCPHREKLGWLEQTYLMGPSIRANVDITHLAWQTIRNMQDAQTDDGLIPSIAPEFVRFDGAFRDSPEWGSAAIQLPWLLAHWTGDRRVLAEAWPMMRRYHHHLESKAQNDLVTYGLGDWYDLGPERPGVSQLTPLGLTATAIYYDDTRRLADVAAQLGHSEEHDRLDALARRIGEAFNRRFYDANTASYATGSQTSLAMPLVVGLVPPAERPRVAQRLLARIRENNLALTAGDIGFHYLVQALTDLDADDLIFAMNQRDDVPGYGYQLKRGATALTESWAALEEVSNNHLMLGHLMQWFFEGLAGIRQAPDSTGFRRLRFEPAFLRPLDDVDAETAGPYGPISSRWHRDGGTITLEVSVPVNCSAVVVLPVRDTQAVNESGRPLSAVSDVIVQSNREERLELAVGSGDYSFTFPSP